MKMNSRKWVRIVLTALFLIVFAALNPLNALADELTPTPTICYISAGSINHMALSSDGKTILTNWNPGEARLWDIQTGKVIQTFAIDAGSSANTSVALSPDGNYVAVGVALKAVIWDSHTGKQLYMLPRTYKLDTRTDVTFSGDSGYLMTSGSDGATLWDIKAGRKVFSFAGNHEPILGQKAYLSPDDRYILTPNAWDFQIDLWDAKTGLKLHTFENTINATFTPDAKAVLTHRKLDGKDELLLWDIKTFQLIQSFGEHNNPAWQVSADSQYLLVHDEVYTLWDMQTGEQLEEFSFGYIAGFLPDHSHLLVTNEKPVYDQVRGKFEVWDMASRQTVTQFDILSMFSMTASSLLISNDGKYLFFASVGWFYMMSLGADKQLRQFC